MLAKRQHRNMNRKERALLSVAYHEAGHAVAAFALGVPVQRATIVPGEESAGHIKHAKIFPRSDSPEWDTSYRNRGRAERSVIIFLAGDIAERHHNPKRRRGDAGDRHAAIRLLDAFARSDDHLQKWFKALMQETDDIITSKRWWPKVEAVAQALVQHRKMSGKEVTACIRAVFQREFDDAVRRNP